MRSLALHSLLVASSIQSRFLRCSFIFAEVSYYKIKNRRLNCNLRKTVSTFSQLILSFSSIGRSSVIIPQNVRRIISRSYDNSLQVVLIDGVNKMNRDHAIRMKPNKKSTKIMTKHALKTKETDSNLSCTLSFIRFSKVKAD